MQLNQVQDQFKQMGVGVVVMTYDSMEKQKQFYTATGLAFPMLQDVGGAHVDAWGIRNEQYGPGSFAYGVPHPGSVLISPAGRIMAKYAQPGYRSRPVWQAVIADVRSRLGQAPATGGGGMAVPKPAVGP